MSPQFPKGTGWNRALLILLVIMGVYFATEADTLIDIVCEVGLNKIYLNI